MNNPTGAQFDIGLRAVRKGDGSWGSSSVDLYMMRYDDPDDAQRLLRRFWEISDFPESQLVESLKTTADTVIDDDYTEFLRGSTLLKAALAMLGFQSPEKIDAALQAGNCLSEKTAGVAALFQMPRTGYLVPLAEKFSKDFPAVEFAFMLHSWHWLTMPMVIITALVTPSGVKKECGFLTNLEGGSKWRRY